MTTMMQEYDAWLARGPVVHVRPAQPEDRAVLRTLHERLSLRSLHSRYFTAAPAIERNLEQMVRPADDSHETVVVTIEGAIVAVGCFERLGESDRAEIALLVDDAHQHLGLGTLLLSALVTRAAAVGVRRIVAETLPTNTAMLNVFHDCGLRAVVRHDVDTLHIEIPLDEDARPAHCWPDPAGVVLDPPLVRCHQT